MKKIFWQIPVIGIYFLLSSFCYAQEKTDWSREEALISEAFFIRAKVLEEKTGFRFDRPWTLRVKVDEIKDNRKAEIIVYYFSEIQSIVISPDLAEKIKKRHKASFNKLSPKDFAEDELFGEIIDHELGHALMDQVSRRIGNGAWFNLEYLKTLKLEERIGKRIVSEGVAQYFQNINFPQHLDFFEADFPNNHFALLFYLESCHYDCALWLVGDILKQHNERGLIWIINNPYIAVNGQARKEAVAYRELALKELTN